jgi:hypothetical protein
MSKRVRVVTAYFVDAVETRLAQNFELRRREKGEHFTPGAASTSAVPRHANKWRAVAAEVGGPPVLRLCHQPRKIFVQNLVVETLELLRILEILADRIATSVDAADSGSTGSGTSHGWWCLGCCHDGTGTSLRVSACRSADPRPRI